MKAVLVLLLLGFSQGVLAQTPDLEKLILEAQKNCPMLNCPSEKVRVIEMSSAEYRDLGKDKRAQLKAMGTRLAEDLWGDTILEGPYEHASRYRLENVQKLMINDIFEGYRITYSDKAWDIDTCDFNPEDRSTLKNCKTGRITESAFVDAGLTQTLRDYEAMATYSDDEEETK